MIAAKSWAISPLEVMGECGLTAICTAKVTEVTRSEATDFTQVTFFVVECLGTGKRLRQSSKVHICMCIQKEQINLVRM